MRQRKGARLTRRARSSRYCAGCSAPGFLARLFGEAGFRCLGRKIGGAKRDRTADLLHAMQALSQLSYGPVPIKTGLVPGPPYCISNAALKLARLALASCAQKKQPKTTTSFRPWR